MNGSCPRSGPENQFSGGFEETDGTPKALELVRKDVAKLDFEPVQDGFELVQRDVPFPHFEPVQHRVADPGFPGELGIRKLPPLFAQEFGQLSIKAFSHF